MRPTRQRRARLSAWNGALGLLALTVQLVLPVLHFPTETVGFDAPALSTSGFRDAVAGADASAPGSTHDAALCPACRMLRHSGHGLLNALPCLACLRADAGACTDPVANPPAEAAFADRLYRGPPPTFS